MSIHPPKRITSSGGLGPNTQKSIEWLADDQAVTTEVWPKLETPWRESGVIIANEGYVWKTEWKVGERFVRTDIYDPQENFIATYIDICRPVALVDGVFSFEDMYLDVWQPAGEKTVLLDEDELKAAVERNIIAAEDAVAAIRAASRFVPRIDF